MKKTILGLILCLNVTPLAASADVRRAERPVGGEYLVMFSPAFTGASAHALADELTKRHGARVITVWDAAVPGVHLAATPAAARAISADWRVLSVEENALLELAASQGAPPEHPAPWHLDRIDQVGLPLNRYYRYTHSGEGVAAYVIDSGVLATHEEFWKSDSDPTSRVLSGYQAPGVTGGTPTNPCPNPETYPCLLADPACLGGGHGTAVASVLAGRTFGVAKAATIIPVRIVNCAVRGSLADAISGLEWVYNDYLSRNMPAVANLSLGLRVSDHPATGKNSVSMLESSINKLIDLGVVVVAAAQNANEEATLWTPQRLARGNGGRVITVGGSADTDERWTCEPAPECERGPNRGSNYGVAVDIFAPAEQIRSAAIQEPSGAGYVTSTRAERQELTSGTSFAAPIVAGRAANLLSGSAPSIDAPESVWATILQEATTGKLCPSTLMGAPNRLLFQRGVASPRAGDLNGDGHADLVWRNSATGVNAVWFMNGESVLGNASLPIVADTGWHIEAVSDLDGDGDPDLFWRHEATGANAIWQMQNTGYGTSFSLPAVFDPNWSVAGAADFSGDGRADLVWRNQQTGGNAVWVLGAPGAVPTSIALPGLTDLTWRLGAVGDFTGDGHSDLVWHNAMTGAVAIWAMEGTAYRTSFIVEGAADSQWSIAGSADYNSDGDLDLVWRNLETGGNAFWYLGLPAGTLLRPKGFAGVTHDLGWRIAGPR